ncbi:hypothetical protein RCH09_003900 [Actimicrobium sp. GrIS 1.19]|nr:hypothetical protein [Actimicrobium sp. GrIS 1.19]
MRSRNLRTLRASASRQAEGGEDVNNISFRYQNEIDPAPSRVIRWGDNKWAGAHGVPSAGFTTFERLK